MQKAIVLLFPALILCAAVSVSYGGLYRWVDEDGNVHYSDSMPPERVGSGHTELSDRGVRINTVPAAQTLEEVQKQKELERMRAEQEALVKEQLSADRDFLNAFRSEDDISMIRDGKIAHVDVMIEVTKTNILRHQERLARLLAKAANLERAGESTPEQLSDGIAQAQRAIRDAYAGIVAREEQKRAIRASFERDMERFRRLKNLPAYPTPAAADATQPILHNILACPDSQECDRLWEKATDYVRRHSTTPVQASSDIVFITAPPTSDQDVSLILSRINDEKGPGASLFLDVQCERSARGKELCQSEQAQGIIEGFRPALAGEEASRP